MREKSQCFYGYVIISVYIGKCGYAMPYCPKCRDEFQNWVEVCPDCQVALVDELPPVPEPTRRDNEPIVSVAIAPNETVAYMWAGILEENGIRCMVKSGQLRAAMYVLPVNQQCEIYVIASEAEKAAEILAPFLRDEPLT